MDFVLRISFEERTEEGKETEIIFSLFRLSNKEREELKIPFLLSIERLIPIGRNGEKVSLFIIPLGLIFPKRIKKLQSLQTFAFIPRPVKKGTDPPPPSTRLLFPVEERA
jgi:hypothetical protein